MPPFTQVMYIWAKLDTNSGGMDKNGNFGRARALVRERTLVFVAVMSVI